MSKTVTITNISGYGVGPIITSNTYSNEGIRGGESKQFLVENGDLIAIFRGVGGAHPISDFYMTTTSGIYDVTQKFTSGETHVTSSNYLLAKVNQNGEINVYDNGS